MAKKNSIVLEIDAVVNGQKAVGNLSVNMQQLDRVTRGVRNSFESMSWAAVVKGVETVQSSINTLTSTMKGLTDAYAVQEAAERKLETTMRNTMGASLEQVNAVKELCSAQQELGVIGDEVQLQGAQKLANYLKEASTLRTLIPLMNDLAASEAGLAATGADTERMATALGKAMQGQVTSLQKMGFQFSDAQKQVLQFGTESEKAAVLTEVLGQKVGGMNEALAQTASGKMKQMSNALGDIQERLGRVASAVMPVLTGFNTMSTAVTGVLKFTAGIKACTASMRAWAASARTAQVAVRGLLISTGVGAAIAALGWGIEKVMDATDKAKASADEYSRALREQQRSYTDISQSAGAYAQQELSTADKLMKVIRDETKRRDERTKAVKELQTTYPGYFSQVNAERIEIETLTSCYNDLKEAILKASRARAAQSLLDQNTQELLSIEARLNDKNVRRLIKGYNKAQSDRESAQSRANASPSYANVNRLTVAKGVESNIKGMLDDALGEDYNDVLRRVADLTAANDRLAKTVENSGSYKLGSTETTVTTPTTIASAPEGSEERQRIWHEEISCIQDLIDNLNTLEGDRLTATEENVGAINKQIEQLRALRKEWESIGLEEEEVLEAPSSTNRYAQLAEKVKEIGKEFFSTFSYIDNGATTLRGINRNIEILTEQLQDASVDEAAGINQSIKLWQAKADAIRKAGETSKVTFDTFRAGWGGIKTGVNAVAQLNETLKGDASLWNKVSASVDAAISVYDGISAVVRMIRSLTSATDEMTAVTQADTIAKGANAAASKVSAAASGAQAVAAAGAVPVLGAETTSNIEDAAAKTMNAHAWLPFVGIGLAGAMIGVMIAQMANLPKFAEGGIAYGPTLGLFGEYPGADNNPEVVAPLDKLRALIEPKDGLSGDVRFHIDGDDLVGVLSKRNNKVRRTIG